MGSFDGSAWGLRFHGVQRDWAIELYMRNSPPFKSLEPIVCYRNRGSRTVTDGQLNEASSSVAIITGITGQDGSYMTELLLTMGYNVVGVIRPSSSPQPWRLAHLNNEKDDRLQLYYGDVIDSGFIRLLINSVDPDEIYHFAAQSNVPVSFNNAEYSTEVNALGTLRLLEAIKEYMPMKSVKFYNACTSELFGESEDETHNETSVFHPKSPYGLSKLYSFWATRHYREAYGIFAVNGILFNHESPRRGELFVTQKIAESVARVFSGDDDHILRLGNLDSYRDWGHAKDYMEGVWRMMQAAAADDFVLCSGESHSVREFAELAFLRAGFRIRWEGSGEETIGIDDHTGRTLVRVDQALYRVLDINRLQGDYSKARKILGWNYTRRFEALVNEMVESAILAHTRKVINQQINALSPYARPKMI